jgi:hypothetical protein
MHTEQIKKYFKHISKEAFMNYFYTFKKYRDSRNNVEIIQEFKKNNEIWTDKSCAARAKKGKTIFKKNLEHKTLKYIIESSNPNKVGQQLIQEAKAIYEKEKIVS